MGYQSTNELGAVESKVSFKREELEAAEKKYQIIEDSIAGEIAVKARGATYLPIPSSCETASVFDPQYVSYQTRAVYYNVAQPTRDALVGQIFLRPPMIDLPESLEGMRNDTNGEGLTLEQLIRKTANYVLPYGRGGLLSDFPSTDGEVTRAQLRNREIQPIIQFYEPWAIRNWRVNRTRAGNQLVLLVLDEVFEYTLEDKEFEITNAIRHRVYRMRENGCTVQVYQPQGTGERLAVTPETVVKDANGEALSEIPFEFIGSENNDVDIDEPPFYNLANLNIAHFRNSADYEESSFLVGQPTPVYSGLTEDWVENYFDGGVAFGARTSVPLPEGASAQLLQAAPNSLAFEAMIHKEDQMIAIGAKILNPQRNTVEKKQAEIEIEAASQRSVLTTIVDNIELAMTKSLQRVAAFVGEGGDSVKIELNRNFDLTSASPEEIRWLIELWKESMITFPEIRENLRRTGFANPTLTDDDAMAEILSEQELRSQISPVEKQKSQELELQSKQNQGDNNGPPTDS